MGFDDDMRICRRNLMITCTAIILFIICEGSFDEKVTILKGVTFKKLDMLPYLSMIPFFWLILRYWQFAAKQKEAFLSDWHAYINDIVKIKETTTLVSRHRNESLPEGFYWHKGEQVAGGLMRWSFSSIDKCRDNGNGGYELCAEESKFSVELKVFDSFWFKVMSLLKYSLSRPLVCSLFAPFVYFAITIVVLITHSLFSL